MINKLKVYYMQKRKHYMGLTDKEVLESRKKYGINNVSSI